MSKDSIPSSEVNKIVLACEAGMGSSLMVKNGLIKKLTKAGLDINVEHSPVNLIPADADGCSSPRSRWKS